MEKAYKNIVFFFIGIVLIILMGFYNTYFVYFPKFEGFKSIHHIHGSLMVLWLLIMIVQPILISNKQYKWHKLIGKLSYFLVPVIIVTMFLAYKNSYQMAELNGESHSENLGILFLPFTDIFPFATFYILAIVYKNNLGKHLRYMISIALSIVGASLVRILFQLSEEINFFPAIMISSFVVVLFFIGFILYDSRKGIKFTSNPFTIALITFTIPNILLGIVPNTSIWQSFADKLANIIF